ncbi:T9SS type A sorting domain-containing protein [Marinoscillum pacificum]|uniref:T9SS type A sorting domain-containing protein n=1 Tax=Marinoscillum pacificum TaxID=392723 RepID=UPI002158992E|nr:PKD domain-containing protein [Marinoscillum pacificum]
MNNKLTPYQNLSRVTLGLLLMMLLSTALNAKTVAADSICNAEYTYRIDSVGNIPVYTFSATYPNNQYTYEWNIGGSLIRTGSTIEHIFNDAGGWGVTLTAFSATDTCTSYQNVGAMPPPEDECFFNTWQINDSTYAVETWLPMFWEDMSSTIDFGDGTVVAHEPVHGEHITHTYDSAGTYTICQTMGANDCSYCKEIEFELSTIPTCNADFTYTIDSTGNIPVYTFSAINPNNQYSYEWKFNEGLPRTGASIEHIFADWDDWTGGEFDVTLTSYNQTDTCSTIQTIKAEFPPFDVCFFNTWQIDDSTYAIETSLPMYWEDMSSSVDFGDGTVIAYEPEIGEYITHSYNKPGTYTICQTMDTDDCSYCKEVSVGTASTECPTTFNYELIDSLNGEYEYHFSPLEIDSTARYIWTFDLNEETEAFTANYTFTTPGTHEVNLQIYTDNSFCDLSEYIDIEENVEPISCPTSFNYEIDSLNSLIYAFYPTEIDSAASYTWKIDSIDVSTNASFTYQFEEAGQYVVNLSINKGDSLCNLAEVINVESSEVPITCPSSFNYQVDSLNTLEYSFGVEEYDTAATSYSWFINEEQVGYEAYFNYTFPEGGLYSVDLLIAYDASECLVSDSILVEAPIDSITCTTSFNYQVDSLNTLEYSFGVDEYDTAATTYSWFINEEQVGYEAYFNYTFPEGGLYSVDLLIAYDTFECLVSDSILVEAPIDSIICPTSFNYQMDSLNTLEYSFGVEEYDTAATTYSWFINEEQVGFEAYFNYTFPEGGLYSVDLLIAYDASECLVSDSILVEAPIDSIICPTSFNYHVDSLNTLNYSFGVEEYDTAATTYSWFINEEQVGYEAYFNYTFPKSGLYSVDLFIAYDASECLVSDSILVEAPLDSLVCPTSFNAVLVDSLNTLNYQFSPLEIDNSASYLWAVDGAISTEAVYTYNFPSAGNYDVTLTTVKEQDTCEVTQTIAVMAGTLHIQGMLYADLVPVVDGSLLLYQEIDNRWTYSNQVSTTNGHFIFENLAPGTYLLHGMGDRTIHEAFIPTYFVNGVSWKDAFEIELTGSAEELKITLIKAQGLTNGHGRIRATMNTHDFDSQIVLLKDRNSNETVKWTISEGDQFSFSQLPLGAYRITMEMPSESFSMNVDVTDNQPEVNLNLDMFNILSSDDVAQKELIVYPTAVENEVFIHNPSPSSSELTIKVISMTGQKVLSRSVKIASNGTYQLSLSNLDRGMYIILTEDSEGHKNNYRIQK